MFVYLTQVTLVLDLYGSNSEKDWYKQKERIEANKRKFQEDSSHNNVKDKLNQQRYRRRYSPPEQNYRPPPLVRSNSYHNLQYPSYIKELRFP